MRMMQRVVLVLMLVSVFMLGTVGGIQKKKWRLQEQWGLIQTERMLQTICRTGKCSYEDYYSFYLALCHCGIDAEIRIEEYQKEQDRTGLVYYYLIPWEELQLSFMEENVYEFKEESVVRIEVRKDSILYIELWRELKNDF